MNLKEQIALAIFNAELSKNSLPEMGHDYKSLWRKCLSEAEDCIYKSITDHEDILDVFDESQKKLIMILIRENRDV